MFKSKQILNSPFDFDNAMFFGVNVEVWQHGDIVDSGGKILANTIDSVHINDGKYLKTLCEFRVS